MFSGVTNCTGNKQHTSRVYIRAFDFVISLLCLVHGRISVLYDVFVQLSSYGFSLCYIFIFEQIKMDGWMDGWKSTTLDELEEVEGPIRALFQNTLHVFRSPSSKFELR